MIVITGASDGLGLQLAKLYKASGKTVVNISRRECQYADQNLLHDLTEGQEIVKASQEVMAIDEPLEAVINCAGVFTSQSLGSITEDEIKKTMASNVKATVLLISELIDRIKKDESDIVNVVSSAGTKATTEYVYGASKWAVRGFTQGLQVELKNTACRVVSFCPGGMDTGLFEKAIDKKVDGQENWMRPEDIAVFMKQILDLPKNIEVSEVIINRKSVKA